MRVGFHSWNPLVNVVQAMNALPVPLLETQVGFTVARAIQAGVELGIFDALEGGPLGVAEIARRRQTCPPRPRSCCTASSARAHLGHPEHDRVFIDRLQNLAGRTVALLGRRSR